MYILINGQGLLDHGTKGTFNNTFSMSIGLQKKTKMIRAFCEVLIQERNIITGFILIYQAL